MCTQRGFSMPQGTTQELDDAVEEVMALMFERSCTPAAGLPSIFPSTATHICLSDPLNGASSLFIDLNLAQQLTSDLLQKPIPEIPSVMVTDTIGELCNMITGSWKARQPPDLALSKLSPPMKEAAQGRFRDILTRAYKVGRTTFVFQLGFCDERPT